MAAERGTSARRTLDDALVAEFRDRLLAARARFLRTVAITTEELGTLEAHQPGAPIEDTPREQVLAILSRLEGREQHELDEIDAAYSRLEAGTFGVCESCGASFPLTRLRAMPTARYCLGCQATRERAGRR